MLSVAEYAALRRCGDCGVAPGGTHHVGCDKERCGRCGGQAISCGCTHAPTEEDENATDPTKEAEYFDLRVNQRWQGIYPGTLECRKLGFWCRRGSWIPCETDHPDATENLNRLAVHRYEQREPEHAPRTDSLTGALSREP
jgi:hypothetical protein